MLFVYFLDCETQRTCTADSVWIFQKEAMWPRYFTHSWVGVACCDGNWLHASQDPSVVCIQFIWKNKSKHLDYSVKKNENFEIEMSFSMSVGSKKKKKKKIVNFFVFLGWEFMYKNPEPY